MRPGLKSAAKGNNKRTMGKIAADKQQQQSKKEQGRTI
jgi:hypothetical protein